jgi:hypothetical protein
MLFVLSFMMYTYWFFYIIISVRNDSTTRRVHYIRYITRLFKAKILANQNGTLSISLL